MEWLREIRAAAKISQEAVAHSAGVTQQHLSEIETGKKRPSVAVAKRIAAVLGFDWTRFYEEV